ncbi:MAG: DUF1573 domain-containing protein [bacterium]
MVALLLLKPPSTHAGATVSADSANEAGLMSCSWPVHDFGSLDNGETVRHTFVLHNSGEAVLEIGKIHGCCGATWELSSRSVQPHSEAMLAITMPLKGRSGAQEASFFVRSNDPAQPLYELKMRGFAVAKVDVQPACVMLAATAADAAQDRLVTITCQPDIGFRVTNIVVSSPCVSATYVGASGNVHRVAVRVVAAPGSGTARADVRVLTDHPEYKILDIPVLVSVKKDIVVFPNEVRLDASAGRQVPGSWYGVVRSISRAPFRITGTESPAKGAEFTFSPMANGGYKVEIRNLIPHKDLDGRSIILRTDSEAASEVVIPIRIIQSGVRP